MKYLIIATLAVLISSHSLYPNMVIDRKDAQVTMFESQTDFKGWKAAVKGIILSFAAREDAGKENLSQMKHEKTEVTVRLYNRDGIDRGTTLFIIDKNELAVAKLTVKTISFTKTLGYILIGHGNFFLANEGDRVVVKTAGALTVKSRTHKGRGDYNRANDDTAKSIAEYKEAIKTDSGNPEAHLELGLIYFSQGVYNFADREFRESYRNINRLYDNEDKFILLKSITELKYREIFYSYLAFETRQKFFDEGIKSGKEALVIYPDSIEVNFFIAMLYYKFKEEFEINARDHFLKVVKLNPEHIDANIALSELYLKHKNSDKARKFAENAMKAEPGNRRVRELLKTIERAK